MPNTRNKNAKPTLVSSNTQSGVQHFRSARKIKQQKLLVNPLEKNDQQETKRQKLADTTDSHGNKTTKKVLPKFHKQIATKPLEISDSEKENVAPENKIAPIKKRIGTRKAMKNLEKEKKVDQKNSTKKQEQPKEEEDEEEPQTPSIRKRKRSTSRNKGYDFTNSPNSGEEALENIKKHKVSTSPGTAKILAPKKAMTTQERIAALRQKRAAAAAKPKADIQKEPEPERTEEKTEITKPPVQASTSNIEPAEKKQLSVKERIALLRAKKLAKQKENENATPKTSEPNPRLAEIKNSLKNSEKTREKLHQQSENKTQEAELAVEKFKTNPDHKNKNLINKEEFLKYNGGNLKQLQLPLTYSKLKSTFIKLDQIVFTLHNRKDNILVSRLERDVTYGSKIRFTTDLLRKIMSVKDDSYLLEWKKGIRNQNSVTEDKNLVDENYQMCVKPILEQNLALIRNSETSLKTPEKTVQRESRIEQSEDQPKTTTGWIKMTAKHLNTRKNDFAKKLAFLAHSAHNKFLSYKLNIPIDEINQKFPINKLKKFHNEFIGNMDEEELDGNLAKILNIPMVSLPLKPSVLGRGSGGEQADSLYSTPTNSLEPGAMGDNNCKNGQTGKSRGMRDIFGAYMENQRKKQQTGETTVQSTSDSGVSTLCNNSVQNTPQTKQKEENLQGFSESLQKKYQERKRRNQEKEVFKQHLDKVKERNEIKSLYDIARSLKSYFTVNKAWSSDISTIVKSLIKSSSTSISAIDCEAKLKKLADLEVVKETACLKVTREFDGRVYVKMTPGTKLKVFSDAVARGLETLERL